MGTKTSIAITLDNPYFVAGDYVRGKVHLNAKQTFDAQEILLILDGKQFAETQDKKQFKKSENTIYATYMILHQFPQNRVLKGQYTFPFSFMLESHLPGTFNLDFNKKDHAQIKYFIRTELISLSKDVQLKHSAQLTIRQIMKAGVRPSSCEAELMTTSFCCLSGGFGNMKVNLDKNVYIAGESALLTCTIDNLNTSSTFDVKAQLVQVISINGEQISPSIYKNIVYEEQLPSFRKKQASTFTVKIPLNAKKNKKILEPSVNGKVIDCKYHLQIVPKYSRCCKSESVTNFILPLIVQAEGGITIIDAPNDWQPFTYDSQLLLVTNRDSFIQRQGKNPYIEIMENDPFV